MRLLLICSFFLLLFGCNAPAAIDQTAMEDDTKEATDEVFGAEEDFSHPINYTMLVDKLAATADDTLTLTVKGEVNEVCQAKGCWMTVDGEDEVMVKFKDYGFFMPKDISGREVVMHGKAYYQTTPVDELRHYAEDAGKPADEIAAITEPKRELMFLASGVLLLAANDDESDD